MVRKRFFINTLNVVSVNVHRQLSIKVPWVFVNHVGTLILR